jgi:hypothetical protein
MRMTETRKVMESRPDTWLEWLGQVEDHRVTRSMIVCKQLAAIGHPVFGVVDLPGNDSGGGRRQELAVMRRRGVGINHSDEILAPLILIARPREKIMTRPRRL